MNNQKEKVKELNKRINKLKLEKAAIIIGTQKELSRDIKNLLFNYTKDTGFLVSSVSVSTIAELLSEATVGYRVSIEVNE